MICSFVVSTMSVHGLSLLGAGKTNSDDEVQALYGTMWDQIVKNWYFYPQSDIISSWIKKQAIT